MPLVRSVQESGVQVAAFRHQQTIRLEQRAVLAQSLLDVGRGRFVHADVQHNSPLKCRLRCHHHLRRACIVTDQHSLSALVRLTIAS